MNCPSGALVILTSDKEVSLVTQCHRCIALPLLLGGGHGGAAASTSAHKTAASRPPTGTEIRSWTFSYGSSYVCVTGKLVIAPDAGDDRS